MTRRIPPSGVNLFQSIYGLVREYAGRTGQPALNLSLGNPDGVPPADLLALQARFAADPAYELHAYAEDGNLRGFAERMVELHSGVRVGEHKHLRALPIPGIKTASALMPLACALHLPDAKRRDGFAVASNLPAYDVIGTWTSSYFGAKRVVWPLLGAMRLEVDRLESALRAAAVPRADLIFVIRPGNPAAVGASAEDWRALIAHCLRTGARLVNDAAYAGLARGTNHVPLAAVAKDFPELEWIEMYSVSKSFSDPGARLGALIGSKDFVEDYLTIKGNTDSGPVPSVMAAYGEYFQDLGRAERALSELRALYDRRLAYVIPLLKAAGLRPACETDAGFFTLWEAPRSVLGADVADAEAFNKRVISETGLVGVHFRGPADAGGERPLIRYAVCADVLEPRFQERFEKALRRLHPVYER